MKDSYAGRVTELPQKEYIGKGRKPGGVRGASRRNGRKGDAFKAADECDHCGDELPKYRRVHIFGEGFFCCPCWEARWSVE